RERGGPCRRAILAGSAMQENKAAHSPACSCSGCSVGEKNPGIRRKHPLLREFFNRPLTIGPSQGSAPFGITQQAGERAGEGTGIIAVNDELLVILAHDLLHI